MRLLIFKPFALLTGLPTLQFLDGGRVFGMQRLNGVINLSILLLLLFPKGAYLILMLLLLLSALLIVTRSLHFKLRLLTCLLGLQMSRQLFPLLVKLLFFRSERN